MRYLALTGWTPMKLRASLAARITRVSLLAMSRGHPQRGLVQILARHHFVHRLTYPTRGAWFCGKGEAKEFVARGAIEIGGKLPINTHGGQLGEAHIHGDDGIAEGVRQLRGASVDQVDGVEHVLVTAGTGVPTKGLILG